MRVMSQQFKAFKLWVRRLAPASLVHVLRPLPYFVLEWFQPRLKVDGVPVPPLWKMYEGPRDKRLFLRNSREALDIYDRYGGISQDSHILDIGSGLGRKTFCLIEHLSHSGRYIGIDIDQDAVTYLNRIISSRHPQFTFVHVDLYNGYYNRSGTVNPSQFHFPFGDSTMDLVVAWSVFTHMLPDDVAHYLLETSRLLKANGRSIFSFFIISPAAMESITCGRAQEALAFEGPRYFTNNRNIPEDVIAFSEDTIKSMYDSAGLEIKETLPGSWIGDGKPRDFPTLNYQDIIVAEKRPPV